MAIRELIGPRLSQIARCPCAAVYQASGCQPAQPTPRMLRYWSRGNLYSYEGGRQLIERYGADDVEQERKIAWQVETPDGFQLGGVGHADFYVRSEKCLYEVKSSISPSNILDSAILQAKLYLYFDEEAESAAVWIMNPSDLDREDLVPVVLTDSDRRELQDLLQSVAQAVDGGPLPPCTEGSPSNCRRSGCLYSEYAWDGWEEPPANPVEASTRMLTLIGRWQALKNVEASARLAYSERKDVEAQLVELGVEPGDNDVGAWTIRRTISKPRETFSWSTAKKSGCLAGLEELLAPFVKIGEPSERFEIVSFE